MVAGWFGSARRACSRDWWSDWPFSDAVGNHRTESPVNRRFWCWVPSDTKGQALMGDFKY